MKKVIFILIIILSSLLIYKNIYPKNNNANTFELDFIDLDMIKSFKTPTLVNFCSDYNLACAKINPTLKMLFNELNSKDIKIFNINIFDNTKHLNSFPISSIPIQFFFNKYGKSYKPSEELGLVFHHSTMNEVDFYYHIGILSKDEIIKIFNEMQSN